MCDTNKNDSHPFTVGISELREGQPDAVLNTTIKELIYHHTTFIVYLDDKNRIQYRGNWEFPDDFEEILFEAARLESLTYKSDSFFGTMKDDEQVFIMRRLIAEVIAKLHRAPDTKAAAACLVKAEQVITSIVNSNTRLRRAVSAGFATVLVGLGGWLWVFFHKEPGGIGPSNEFGLWLSLGAIGALLSSLTRIHNLEVQPFTSNWQALCESSARILAGAIGALLLIAASKANLAFGSLTQPNAGGTAFWGLIVLSILAGASERLVPDFIGRMDSSQNTTPAKSGATAGSTVR